MISVVVAAHWRGTVHEQTQMSSYQQIFLDPESYQQSFLGEEVEMASRKNVLDEEGGEVVEPLGPSRSNFYDETEGGEKASGCSSVLVVRELGPWLG